MCAGICVFNTGSRHLAHCLHVRCNLYCCQVHLKAFKDMQYSSQLLALYRHLKHVNRLHAAAPPEFLQLLLRCPECCQAHGQAGKQVLVSAVNT
jgi:hypothetical protein